MHRRTGHGVSAAPCTSFYPRARRGRTGFWGFGAVVVQNLLALAMTWKQGTTSARPGDNVRARSFVPSHPRFDFRCSPCAQGRMLQHEHGRLGGRLLLRVRHLHPVDVDDRHAGKGGSPHLTRPTDLQRVECSLALKARGSSRKAPVGRELAWRGPELMCALRLYCLYCV